MTTPTYTTQLPTGTDLAVVIKRLDTSKFLLVSSVIDAKSGVLTATYAYTDATPGYPIGVISKVTPAVAGKSGKARAAYSLRLGFLIVRDDGTTVIDIDSSVLLAVNIDGDNVIRDPDTLMVTLSMLFGLTFSEVDGSSYPVAELVSAWAQGVPNGLPSA